jgi:hypothetical protein
MELTPEQREKIRRLLEDELRSALSGTDAATADEILADRRHALEQLVRAAHDPHDLIGEEREGGRVGEDR